MNLIGNTAVMACRMVKTDTIQKLILDAGKGVIAFSTRRNVADTDVRYPYAGFNVCHYVGDDDRHVETCRSLLANEFDVDLSRIIIPRQIHSSKVAVLDCDGVCDHDLEVDAMVTNRQGVMLCVNTADCLPVVFNDSDNRVIGVAHAGWRGIVGGIIGETVRKMITLGASVKNIRAVVGPCICGDCYEVDEDFEVRFVSAFPSVEGLSRPSGRGKSKPSLDLFKAVQWQLRQSGVKEGHIVSPQVCNHCDNDKFFSARRLGVRSGRILTAVMMV